MNILKYIFNKIVLITNSYMCPLFVHCFVDSTHAKTGGIRVVYSRIGENADTVIKRIIKAEHREWIVVTSDRDIVRAVWSSGSIPISSEDFLSVLEPTEQFYTEEEITEYRTYRRKGNPRTLSKKEKAIRRALRKL